MFRTHMQLIQVLFSKMGLMSKQPFYAILFFLLDPRIYALLIPRGLSGTLVKEVRFFSQSKLSNVLVRSQGWHRRTLFQA
jgi:hypothetical protein